jgi:hypothetical protein
MHKFLLAGVALLALAALSGPVAAQPVGAENRATLANLTQALGWADLAVSCHLRNLSWSKLIHDKATVTIFLIDETSKLSEVQREALGDAVHGEAASISQSHGCADVPANLAALDRIAKSK